LQALCGLRVLEAAALRVQDVDLKAGTVTVTDTGHHKPKTRDSYRTIPVCSEALAALRHAIDGQKVRPTNGEIFTNQKGHRWVKDALTLRWGRTLAHAAAEPKRIKREGTGKPLTLNPHGLGMARLGAIPARKLRAAFATMAGQLGAPDRLLKAYLGHSSGDMLGGHYRRIDLDELRLVSGLMNGWREAAKNGDARKDSGNIPDKQAVNA
jgi:integrase